jgi:hypothetical protein
MTRVSPVRRLVVATVSLGLVTAVMAASALGSRGDWYRLRYNPADQAAARATTLRNLDLQDSYRWNGWQHRATNVSLMPLLCASKSPRTSDLVITGAADAWWERGPGFPSAPSIANRSRIFATARMANLDVRRSWHPEAIRCLEQQLSQASRTSPCPPGSSCTQAERIVTFEEIPFPHVAPITVALRFVTQYRLLEGETRVGTVRVTTYLVVLAKKRTEITLNAFGGRGSITRAQWRGSHAFSWGASRPDRRMPPHVNMGEVVRLTVVPNEGEAEMICGLLRTERIACDHRVTDVSSWANRGPSQFWGWREILVGTEDLGRARELLAAADLAADPAE